MWERLSAWRIWRARLGAGLVAGAILVITATPAMAEWLRAESERFVVYSEGSERNLRSYIQDLETFDRVLRLQMNLPEGEAPPRKLPVYLVRSSRGLETVAPSIGSSVAGFYLAGEEDIFAVALDGAERDYVMLHEYAHHFMLQNFAYGYPAWFIEGFAEYYMTTEISEGRVSLGRFNEGRAYVLMNYDWLPLQDLLSKRSGEMRRRHSETYYPVAWALTHWFMANAERRPVLNAYMVDVGAGADPVEAMERATGLTIAQLERELKTYVRGRMSYFRMNRQFPTVAVTVTRLGRSADDLLLIGQRLKFGVPEDQREATAREVRRLAARHPNDPFARLQLGHAELHFGNRERGEEVLLALLEEQPDNVEALQLMATQRMHQARETDDDDAVASLTRAAREFLRRAYAVDDANYYTLLLLAQTRRGGDGYPDDNDIATWATAYHLAPQLGSIRYGAAEALMYADRNAEAIGLLQPLANNPHGSGEAAQALIERAQARLEEEASVEMTADDVDALEPLTD
jgi:hypothetical protein